MYAWVRSEIFEIHEAPPWVTQVTKRGLPDLRPTRADSANLLDRRDLSDGFRAGEASGLDSGARKPRCLVSERIHP